LNDFIRNKFIILLGVTYLVLSSILIISLSSTNPHTKEGECVRCHLNVPDPKKNEKMIFTKDIDNLCEDCHQLSPGATPPTGMMPSMEIPKDFYLDWMGRMTCATCHEIHQEKEVDSYPYLLRRPVAGRDFCISCHRELSGGKEFFEHKLVIGVAHLEPKYYISDTSVPIDSISLKCLGCHDGTIGKLAESTIVGQGEWQHGRSIGLSHPIGVDYRLAANLNRELRAPENLNPAIKLFEGKVGCGSCHNTFSKHPNFLVMDNRGSALCLECHLK
jgi:predicted CXXCH cytochrome family protein